MFQINFNDPFWLIPPEAAIAGYDVKHLGLTFLAINLGTMLVSKLWSRYHLNKTA